MGHHNFMSNAVVLPGQGWVWHRFPGVKTLFTCFTKTYQEAQELLLDIKITRYVSMCQIFLNCDTMRRLIK